MAVLLEFTSKGKKYKRNVLDILYAQAMGQRCLLIFKNGEVITYPYRLNILEKQLANKHYRRVSKSYVVFYPAFIDVRFRKGILNNGTAIPLLKNEYLKLKKHLAALELLIPVAPNTLPFSAINTN